MTEVKGLVSTYLGIKNNLKTNGQQLKSTILMIKNAVKENVITLENLMEVFLTTIIEQNYPPPPDTELLLKGNLGLSISIEVGFGEYSPDILKKHRLEWLKIIRWEKGKQIPWQINFPELFDGDNVSTGEYFII